MNLLPETFATASIGGLWLPTHWKSSWLELFYRSYTYLTVMTILLIIISQLTALMFLTKNVNELAEAAYLFLTAVNACTKGINVLINRQRIIELTQMFTDKKCVPKNDEESKLCLYYNKIARYMVLSCAVLGICTAISLAVWPLFFFGDNYILSIRGWQPYKITSLLRYWITQTHQMFALMVILFWNCSSDFMCPGFMLQICSQLQLMYHRLQFLPDDVTHQRQLVKQSVQHHLHIFQMKRRLELAFTPAILSQYLLSSLVLCISIYQLTTNRADIVQTSIMFLYLYTMTVELVLYCWFGNDVSVLSTKFSEIICQSNWTKLRVSQRRELLIMMLRSSLPIRITCGPLITLSNDSFTRILKLSYSAFNVLHRSY